MNFWSSASSNRSERPTFTNGIRFCHTQPYRVDVETARYFAASCTVIRPLSVLDCIYAAFSVFVESQSVAAAESKVSIGGIAKAGRLTALAEGGQSPSARSAALSE